MKAKQLAILSATTSVAAPASAMIIHTPLAQPISGYFIYFSLSEQWAATNTTQSLGGDRFTLSTYYGDPIPYIDGFNSGMVARDAYYVKNFSAGDPISSSETFYSTFSLINYLGNNNANWAPGTRSFVGLKFDNNGTDNFGWADIEYATDLTEHWVILYGFAYDDSGASIAAGAIPEPNATGLLAALAAGSAAMLGRRRRAVANAE
jgi:hypothetical protein